MDLIIILNKTTKEHSKLLDAIAEALGRLQVGKVEKKSQPKPPEGTLSPDPNSIIVLLNVTYWSLKVAAAIFDVIRDRREAHAAKYKLDLKDVPQVEVRVKNDAILVPANAKKQNEFIQNTGAI